MTPLTLTVNARLARWLLLAHDERQRKTGEKAWETPKILPLSAWLHDIWLQSWPIKYLLSELQCEKIWEKIIEQDAVRLDLLHLQGVSARTSQAFSLIHEYHLPWEAKLYEQTDEAKTFLRWAKKYKNRLSSLGAIDPCRLMDVVRTSMQAGEIAIPPSLRIMGFEEQSPQLKYFLHFLQEKGTRVDFLSPVPDPETLAHRTRDLKENGNLIVREYENQQGEAQACARWVRSVFQPGERIGIVVPELEKYRELLKRELTAELTPEAIFDLDEQGFNISLAPPLSREPMIKLAMALLNIKTTSVPINTFLSFIQSPVFGFDFPPSSEISMLEYKLRKKRILSIPLEPEKFHAICGSIAKVDALIEALKTWVLHSKNLMPAKWAEELSKFLQSTGWPGRLATDKQSVLSKRYQAFEAWKSCLEQLCSLNQILGPVNRLQALNHLTHIIRKNPFQTKTPEHSIQVIGLLESSGMQFDHLWVMGCHSEALPTHPEPNPFITYEIRTKYSITRSNPQRELKFAEHSLNRLLMAAPKVHFSYPLHEGNMDMELSPLLKRFPKSEETAHPSNRIKDQVRGHLEEFTEPVFLPVTGSEESRYETKGISSGYALLKDQVDCPFRAFARHRLNSQRTPTAEVDFDNLDRGNLIHKALELFWEKTRDHKNLVELSQQEGILEKRIADCVLEALKLCSKRTAGQTQFNKLEVERNVQVIHNWLFNIELQRPDFKVLHNEEDVSINLCGIKLQLRIDRIDEIPGTGLLLIDYKTGKDAKPAEWFAEPLRAPQLPLYTLAQTPAGLAYGHLALGKPEFKGTVVPGFPLGKFKNYDFSKATEYSSWDELLSYWKNNLNTIADEFLQGNNRVLPINKGEPCRHCEFGSLCRVQEVMDIQEDTP